MAALGHNELKMYNDSLDVIQEYCGQICGQIREYFRIKVNKIWIAITYIVTNICSLIHSTCITQNDYQEWTDQSDNQNNLSPNNMVQIWD